MDTCAVRNIGEGMVVRRGVGYNQRGTTLTVLALCVARGITCTSPRYDERPPARATDLDTIADDVFGAMCTILAPESWCWFSLAKANDSVSPLACSPISQMAGYFMVTLDPMLPSTHSMVAPSAAVARLVTRLYTLFDQFWLVV